MDLAKTLGSAPDGMSITALSSASGRSTEDILELVPRFLKTGVLELVSAVSDLKESPEEAVVKLGERAAELELTQY